MAKQASPMKQTRTRHSQPYKDESLALAERIGVSKAAEQLVELAVLGDDYPPHDGTGAHDYIHVVDLADDHLKALRAITDGNGVHVWNLGTGTGYSVLEMLRAFEKAAGRPVAYRIAPRRAAPATSPSAGPIWARPRTSWTGGPSVASRR